MSSWIASSTVIRIRAGVYVMAACALEDGSTAPTRDAMRDLGVVAPRAGGVAG